MKKSIFALLFLLLALIVTCVYQKTYALYALTTEEGNATLPLLEKKAEILSPEKEKIVTEKQSSLDTVKVTLPTIENNISKVPTLLEKIKKTVISVVSSDEKTPEAKASHQKEGTKEIRIKQKISTAKKQPSMNTQEEEKEVVDYLLMVLKERETALSNRDEAETRLQALIKQALENRRIAIETMNIASTQIEESHQKRLKERDANSQNITKEKGN